MKRLLWILPAVFVAAAGLLLTASDGFDAPSVAGKTSDLSDIYVFQSPDKPEHMIFAMTLQSFLKPEQTANARFDTDVLLQFKIDNDGDFVEEKVIQFFFDENNVYTHGSVDVGNELSDVSRFISAGALLSAPISKYQGTTEVGDQFNMRLFAGPVDDPFFFDYAAFTDLTQNRIDSFRNNGTDVYAQTNTLAVAVEVPKLALGGDNLNVWATSNRLIRE